MSETPIPSGSGVTSAVAGMSPVGDSTVFRLLRAADQHFTNGEYSVALIVAQTACEVTIARAMRHAFTLAKISHLAGAVLGLKQAYPDRGSVCNCAIGSAQQGVCTP